MLLLNIKLCVRLLYKTLILLDSLVEFLSRTPDRLFDKIDIDRFKDRTFTETK